MLAERRLIRTTPASASPKAPAWARLTCSLSTTTPTSAALTGNNTVNTPADEAGTCFSPVIHSQTVATLAAIE